MVNCMVKKITHHVSNTMTIYCVHVATVYHPTAIHMIFREHLSIIDKLLTQYHRHSYSARMIQISAEELANYMLISKPSLSLVASLHCKQSLVQRD